MHREPFGSSLPLLAGARICRSGARALEPDVFEGTDPKQVSSNACARIDKIIEQDG